LQQTGHAKGGFSSFNASSPMSRLLSASFGVAGGYLMTDLPGAKETPAPAEISPWPRVVLAAGNIGFFVIALPLASWLARSLAGEGVSWWIVLLIFLVSLAAVDWLLRRVLLRAERRNHAGPGAAADRPRE
jgi:hypothetical protein